MGVAPIFVGSDKAIAISRDKVVSTLHRGLPIFIASKTEDHLADLEHCLQLEPSNIFVEKGFSADWQRAYAKDIVGNIPTFIMCQHRYNSLLDPITSTLDVDSISKIRYNWIIERDTVSEFLYHIASIDGYLRKRKTEIYNNSFGKFNIDENSEFAILRGISRILTITLETKLYEAEIVLSNYNYLSLKNKQTEHTHIMSAHGEDTLGKMISDIILNPLKTKLERL